MILRNAFILLLLISTSIQTKSEKELIIGFGSCLHQDHPQEVWISIKKENLDRFFFLGDNRDSSKYSRYIYEEGYVHKNNLVG